MGGLGQHFQALGHNFSPYITCLFFFRALNWFNRVQMGLFAQSRRLLTICKNLGNERVTQM